MPVWAGATLGGSAVWDGTFPQWDADLTTYAAGAAVDQAHTMQLCTHAGDLGPCTLQWVGGGWLLRIYVVRLSDAGCSEVAIFERDDASPLGDYYFEGGPLGYGPLPDITVEAYSP